MRALAIALLLPLGWACAREDRVEECLKLINVSLECVATKTLQEARAEDPNNVFLQRQTEVEWARYALCKTRARARWSKAQMRELNECRSFLRDYYEKKKREAPAR